MSNSDSETSRYSPDIESDNSLDDDGDNFFNDSDDNDMNMEENIPITINSGNKIKTSYCNVFILKNILFFCYKTIKYFIRLFNKKRKSTKMF